MIDLHTHSTFSDGTLSPKQLIEYASEKQLTAIALTDHDTVEGINEAMNISKSLNIELVPGIELSASYKNSDIHILGLYIDYNNQELIRTLKNVQSERRNRNSKMIKKLNDNGYLISENELNLEAEGNVITRAHFAKLLLKKNYITSINEAFENIIGSDCTCYVKRNILTPKDAIQLILHSNGIPILAHPLLYNLPKYELEELIYQLKDYGLKGLEAIYSLFNKEQTNYLIGLAENHDLLITGGSDFHGKNKPNIDLGTGLGNLIVNYSILEDLKKNCK